MRLLKEFRYILFLLVAATALSSCSESDGDTSNEFTNWQARNEQAFADSLNYAKQHADEGWYIYRCWSMENQTPTTDENKNPLTPTYNEYEDNIVVHVLKQGEGSAVTPLYTDSVKVSYKGQLMPSGEKYPDGYTFDYTFNGEYDANYDVPQNMRVKDVVAGFSTALMKMGHIGDHWKVIMPYTLAYGSSASSSASTPAYSMLRFEIVLKGYYRDGKWITK